MKLSGFAGIITTMFNDKMSIRRYEKSENNDGTTSTELSENPTYTDIPCRISFSSDESPKDSEVDEVPVRNVPKIFCKLDVDIQAGDIVTVNRYDDDGNIIATYEGKVGLPSVFITHKEALFSIERSA
jgi:hypothetical protein